MAKNVMVLRVVIEGLAEELVHERNLHVEIPITQQDMSHDGRIISAIEVDADLMARKLKQEVAAKLREIAKQIEDEG